jgi:hypothetical protein
MGSLLHYHCIFFMLKFYDSYIVDGVICECKLFFACKTLLVVGNNFF